MLARQKALLLQETQSLAFDHYQSFLRASQCANDIIGQACPRLLVLAVKC